MENNKPRLVLRTGPARPGGKLTLRKVPTPLEPSISSGNIARTNRKHRATTSSLASPTSKPIIRNGTVSSPGRQWTARSASPPAALRPIARANTVATTQRTLTISGFRAIQHSEEVMHIQSRIRAALLKTECPLRLPEAHIDQAKSVSFADPAVISYGPIAKAGVTSLKQKPVRPLIETVDPSTTKKEAGLEDYIKTLGKLKKTDREVLKKLLNALEALETGEGTDNDSALTDEDDVVSDTKPPKYIEEMQKTTSKLNPQAPAFRDFSTMKAKIYQARERGYSPHMPSPRVKYDEENKENIEPIWMKRESSQNMPRSPLRFRTYHDRSAEKEDSLYAKVEIGTVKERLPLRILAQRDETSESLEDRLASIEEEPTSAHIRSQSEIQEEISSFYLRSQSEPESISKVDRLLSKVRAIVEPTKIKYSKETQLRPPSQVQAPSRHKAEYRTEATGLLLDDTAQGIDARTVDQITDRFSKIHNSDKIQTYIPRENCRAPKIEPIWIKTRPSKKTGACLITTALLEQGHIDDDEATGRVAKVMDEVLAGRLLARFVSKYPLTGTMKIAPPVPVVPAMNRHAAAIQQRLEYLLMEEKERKALAALNRLL